VRAHRVYGFSPVQQVLMTVNIALRRQLWQLDYFTEGSIPDALIGVPQGWTPDQIKQFQDCPHPSLPRKRGREGWGLRRRPGQAPAGKIRARRDRGQSRPDQGAAAQGRFRRVARPHHLLRLFGTRDWQ
jgi:phage portal protein BeeE